MSRSKKTSQRRSLPRWRAVAINLAVAMGVLYVLTFVPPDNSLAEMRHSGVLRVCLPETAAPLVTADAERPGYDVELLQQIAQDLGVRLAVNHNPAIGADFNPRNWRLTRAQCQIVAGGVVDNETTRGFLQLLPTGGLNGWAQLTPNDISPQPGDVVAVYPGPAALDRLALSRYLRTKKFQIVTVGSTAELAEALRRQQAVLAVSDRLTLSDIGVEDARIAWLSEPELGYDRLAFGLWKGDATLQRAVRESFNKLVASGVQAELAQRYNLAVNF